jgi:3-dehydroquinate synthetase
LPTTLLAMVDASVGGKTGVDLGSAKNCIGAFWQPSAVACDVNYLATEPERGFRSALAEVVKTALIGDPELMQQLEDWARDGGSFEHTSASAPMAQVHARLCSDRARLSDWVRRCVSVKARVVGQDVREDGIRASLNLGHTLGHALEAAGGLGRLAHGEAVSLGLVAAAQIGVRLGVTTPELAQRVERLLWRLGLPTDLSLEPLDAAVELLGLDKKRRGSKVRFVLLKDVASIDFLDLELSELKTLARALTRSSRRPGG